MSQSWCTIESDPGVFTELIEAIGVKDVQMSEVYSLDDLAKLESTHVFGLIFLFRWVKDDKDVRSCLTTDEIESYNLFFASQVINNACATQAILSVLMNKDDVIDIGPELRVFRTFTEGFSPEMKGIAISNSELIRTMHNSFARTEPIASEEISATESDDLFHFIAYVHKSGCLLELDGLKKGPVLLCQCPAESWLKSASDALEKRIRQYNEAEIRFSLMAVTRPPKINLCQEMRAAISRQQRILNYASKSNISLPAEYTAPLKLTVDLTSSCRVTDAPLPPEISSQRVYEVPNVADEYADENTDILRMNELALQAAIIEISDKIQNLQRRILEEDEKIRNWRVENIRRKHNYMPFLLQLVKILSSKGKLQQLVAAAHQQTH